MLFDRSRPILKISRIAIVCAALWLPATGLRAAQEQSGPATLIISYRCAAANRPSFRNSIVKVDTPRFEKWKADRILQDYKLLFNWYVDEDTWDLMAVLTFHTYAGVARWREIESVIAKVRAALAADAKWKALSENKKNIRTEKESVVAEDLSRR